MFRGARGVPGSLAWNAGFEGTAVEAKDDLKPNSDSKLLFLADPILELPGGTGDQKRNEESGAAQMDKGILQAWRAKKRKKTNEALSVFSDSLSKSRFSSSKCPFVSSRVFQLVWCHFIVSSPDPLMKKGRLLRSICLLSFLSSLVVEADASFQFCFFLLYP